MKKRKKKTTEEPDNERTNEEKVGRREGNSIRLVLPFDSSRVVGTTTYGSHVSHTLKTPNVTEEGKTKLSRKYIRYKAKSSYGKY